MAEETDIIEPVRTGIKVASELVIPGGSNFLKGDFKTGGIHAVAGIAAAMFFGFPGMLLVAANSFSQSQTGHGLLDHLGPMLTSQAKGETSADTDDSEDKTAKKTARK